MANNKKMIAIGEAAKYLGISRDTLRRWEKAGRLKAFRSPTNRRYYTREILDAAMAGKKVEATQPEEKKRSKIGKKGRLFVFGTISFILAAILGILVLFFLL